VRPRRLPVRHLAPAPPARPLTAPPLRFILERLRPVVTRGLVLVLLVTGLVFLIQSDALHEGIVGLFEASRQIIARYPVAGPLAFVGLAALSAMLGFFSSAVLVPAAVYAWGAVGTMLLLGLGWTLGGIVAHSLARYLGRPVLRWLVPEAALGKYEKLLEKRPRFSTVLLFQLSFPSEIVAYLMGLIRYPLPKFLGALVIAEIPWVIGTVLLGVGFVERDALTLIAVCVVGAVALALIARTLRKRSIERPS
jgi:uncharacterized membrane protein YdjX (TVP38/TMEM64 family)